MTRKLTLVSLALTAIWMSSAQAETGPYYVGAKETLIHDSNVDRTETPTSDWISSTGVFGGIDQTFGRQHVVGDLSVNVNRYRHVDRLNNTDGRATLHVDWETIDRLSGTFEVSHSQGLFHDFSQVTDASTKTLIRTTNAAFNARLGVVTRWTLEAGVFGNRTRYSSPALQASDIDQHGYSAGIRFTPSNLLSLGVGARHTNGSYPDAQATVPQDFTRNDIDLTGTWQPTGTSTFNGRISRTRLSYAAAAGRDANLTTGSLGYRWRPGGRLTLDASLTRDASANETTEFLFLASQTRVANTALLVGHYELTGKIGLEADLRRIERKLENDITLFTTSTARATDRTTGAGLNATYDPTRSIRLACGASHFKRTFEGDAGLSYPYSVNLLSCSAQIALRP